MKAGDTMKSAVSYEAAMRAEAKKKGDGLLTLDYIDQKGGRMTCQGPAGERSQAFMNQAILSHIRLANHKPDAIVSVILERKRQAGKGFTDDHDDRLNDGSLAACAKEILDGGSNSGGEWFEDRAARVCGKYDHRTRLVIAAALLIAEIERVDRLK
jgi:hypothetical protein